MAPSLKLRKLILHNMPMIASYLGEALLIQKYYRTTIRHYYSTQDVGEQISLPK